MQKYTGDKLVATSMNQKEWDKFGLSWIGSLSEFQKNILILDKGLNGRVLNFLSSIKITVISGGSSNLDSIYLMANYASSNKLDCSYWKCNCYFQSDLNKSFEKDKLKFSSELELGTRVGKCNYLSGDYLMLSYLKNYINFFMNSGSLKSEDDLANLFFKSDLDFIDFTDDWCSEASLHWTCRDQKFYSDDDLIKVVCVPDVSSSLYDNYLFKNVNKAVYDFWNRLYKKNCVVKRRLLK